MVFLLFINIQLALLRSRIVHFQLHLTVKHYINE